MKYRLLEYDRKLAIYEKDIAQRMKRLETKKRQLLSKGQTLADFANGSAYFGFHKVRNGWYYREWAPGAEEMFLTGDFCGWDRHAYPMKKKANGVFQLFLRGRSTLRDGMKVMTVAVHEGQDRKSVV